MKNLFVLFVLMGLIPLTECFGGENKLVINEILASNASTNLDPDYYSFSDWIELRNAGDQPADLNGCYLTDERSNPKKWKINLPVSTGEVQTLVPYKTIWQYWLGEKSPSSHDEWTQLSFDDTAWKRGSGGFGYGDLQYVSTELSSMQNSFSTVYIRKSFSVENPAALGTLKLSIYIDDGFICYINGTQVASYLAPASVTNTSLATDSHETDAELSLELGKVADLLQHGDNVIAIVGFNVRLGSTDFVLAPTLLAKSTKSAGLAPGACQLFWADGMNKGFHTNFKLDGKGENLFLYGPDGNLLDSVHYPAQSPDISFGRTLNGPGEWCYFAEPSPGRENSATGCLTPAAALPPDFLQPGGFYTNTQTIQLTSASQAGIIRYTTDGSIPSPQSQQYFEPVKVSQTTVLRARIYEDGILPSPVQTHSYFIDEIFTIPVISLSTTPAFLWDNKIGIYVTGTNGVAGNCQGAPQNYNQDWERPVHAELFEASGTCGFSVDGGVKIYGACSRMYPQKSLAIYARDKYGTDKIDYALFPDKPISSFKNFVIRNGGNDWIRTLFSDGMMQTLVKDRMDIDEQAYRPAILFINGEYRGIMNIREKLNEDYPAQNYDVDSDKVDLLENNEIVMAGDTNHYDALFTYISSHDIRESTTYTYVQTQMDTDEFMNYNIAKIYFSSMDWPSNNVKFWRPQTENGRWRWMLYDNESGFGIWWSYTDNTLENGSGSANWATFLLYTLLQNTDFRNDFIQRFAAHINTTFDPVRVHDHIRTIQAGIAEEMPRNIERWKNSGASGWGYSIYKSMADWQREVNLMHTFTDKRPSYVWNHIKSKFRLEGTVNVTIKTLPETGCGRVRVNTVVLPEGSVTGKYYKNIPMNIQAFANAGYRFAGWKERDDLVGNAISITPSGEMELTAVFEKAEAVQLVITEIHYHPDSESDNGTLEEFVEIYNAGNSAIDLSGYILSKGIQFIFPEGSSIVPHEYIVITPNADSYKNRGFQVFSWTWGKLDNGGESIELTDANGNHLDFVQYGDQSPWPRQADGEGYSLSLLNPSLDNADPMNWKPSIELGGTPGAVNFSNPTVEDWTLYP